MNQATINQLNRLNQQFYHKVASSFDQTRQQAWQGWEKLLPEIKALEKNNNQPLKVLDLGCGNARFAEFLSENGIQYQYLGVDSNPQLLKKAQEKLSTDKHQFQETDLVELLVSKNQLSSQFQQQYDLVVAFGLLHHIPSFNLRAELVKQAISLLKNSNSLAIFATWQFASEERFQKKLVNPEVANIDPAQLEENDYLLGWQDRENCYRYCHFVDEQEMIKLIKEAGNCKLISSFFADGKSGKLNRYFTLKQS